MFIPTHNTYGSLDQLLEVVSRDPYSMLKSLPDHPSLNTCEAVYFNQHFSLWATRKKYYQ